MADFKNTYQYDPLSRTTQLVQQGNGGNTVKPNGSTSATTPRGDGRS